MDNSDIDLAIMGGIKFKGGGKKKDDGDKFHTKARKRSYKTGSHDSGAARHKAEIRRRVKKRPTQKH